MTDSPRYRIVRWSAAVLLALVVVYPLSYAPVVKWKLEAIGATGGRVYWLDGSHIPAYKPIDWLVDNTPLDKPLFAWARLWGAEDEFRGRASMRLLIRYSLRGTTYTKRTHYPNFRAKRE